MTAARCAAVVLALAACASESPDPKLTVTQSVVGDTTVVAIHGPQLLERTWTSDSVETVWTPEELGAVRRIAVGAGVIVASDGGRVVGFRLVDGTTFPIGTSGEGPGEYRRVASVTIDSTGQVMVVDPRQGRVLVYNAAGEALPAEARPLAASPAWNVQVVSPAPPGATGDLVAWDRGFIGVDGFEDTMHVVHLTDDSTFRALFAVPQGLWGSFDGVPAKREAYGPRAIVALDRRAGAAVTTGTDYLIRWWRPDATPQMLRIEREWPRAVAGQEREPPQELLDGLGPTGTMVRTVVAGQARGEVKHAIDQLVLIGHGRLLVKVVDSTSHYHPYFLGRLPELRPAHWTWEVFDAAGGLRGQLRLASAFTPHRLLACQLWGVKEEEDGTQSVARIDLDDACEWVG